MIWSYFINMKECKQCNVGFEVTDEDRKFYEKVSPVIDDKKHLIPEPKLCPDCRRQRRLVWHNMMNLYQRKCDLTGDRIISNFSPDKPYIVYNVTKWWDDGWDQMDSGRDYDFSRPFFEQYDDLMKSTPFPSLFSQPLNDINCEFTNYGNGNKNCYLIFHANDNEDCFYGFGVKFSKNVVDVYSSFSSELLYSCIDCENCYDLKYSQDCENCSDSLFIHDCIGCKHCIGCHNLRNAEYCIWNNQVSKEEYEKIKSEIEDGSYETQQKWQNDFDEWLKDQPHRAVFMRQCEDCSGDHLFRCQNVHSSYDVKDTRDGKFLNRIFNGPNEDVYDMYQFGMKTAMSYECSVVGINIYGARFSSLCRYDIANVDYCFFCHACKDCFGCSALHNKEYCILNKQYSKEGYQELVPKIIEHMRSTGEWGEFFPVNLSPFDYNETIAQENFPLNKAKAEENGWGWKNNLGIRPDVKKTIPASKLPDKLSDIPDDVLNWAIECEATNRPFRLIKAELKFYRENKIPIPRKHPDQRHLERANRHNPAQLFDRKCTKCSSDIQTTYNPNRPEKVYCGDCYLKEVY
jgi:hypothetical protein